MGKLFEESGTWYVILLPILTGLLLWGLPNTVEILTWLFEGARSLAQASRS